MTNLKDIINSLSTEDRQKMMCAFENGIASFVRLPDEISYLGVYIKLQSFPQLSQTMEWGVWSFGTFEEKLENHSVRSS